MEEEIKWLKSQLDACKLYKERVANTEGSHAKVDYEIKMLESLIKKFNLKKPKKGDTVIMYRALMGETRHIFSRMSKSKIYKGWLVMDDGQMISGEFLKEVIPESEVPKYPLSINTILHTKDGRKFGNAIIIGGCAENWTIKTDYGNTLVFNRIQIHELYYVAYTNEYSGQELTDIQEMQAANHKHRNINY